MAAGFYKMDESGEMLYSATKVLNKDYVLDVDLAESKATQIDGWGFFDDEATARSALGLPEKTLEDILAPYLSTDEITQLKQDNPEIEIAVSSDVVVSPKKANL